MNAEAPELSFDKDRESIIVGELGDVEYIYGEGFYGAFEIVKTITLSSLRRMLVRTSRYLGAQQSPIGFDMVQSTVLVEFNWSLDGRSTFDTEDSVAVPTCLVLTVGGDLLIAVHLSIPDKDPLLPFPELEKLLRHWSSARGGKFIGVESDDWARDVWRAYFRPPRSCLNVEDAARFGDDAHVIVDAYLDRTPNTELLVSLLASGQGEAFVGTPECQSLECKRSVDLDNERNKFELSKDLAAIANSESDGVLVIGFATKTRSGEDIITSVHPVSGAKGYVRRIRRIVDRYVYPPIEGLQIATAPVRDASEIVYCYVPIQPRELKPFVVSGAFLEDRVEGAFITVPRRRNDETINLTPASLHAFLSAGYAMFRNSAADQRSTEEPNS